jgi:hypothetical protein
MRRAIWLSPLLCACSTGDPSTSAAPDAAIPVPAARESAVEVVARVPSFSARLRAAAHARPGALRAESGDARSLRITRADDDGAAVTIVRAGAIGRPWVRRAGVASAEAVAPDTDLVVIEDGDGVEDLTVLRGAAAPRAVRYALTLGPSLASARLAGDRLELVDGEGRVRLSTAPFVAIDADQHAHPLRARWDEARRELALALDAEAADAPLPIVIDPLWTAVASMKGARNAAAAVTLASGKVLVFGGGDTSGTRLTSAEIYDPSANAWSSTGSMPANPFNARPAVVLAGGKVLALGQANFSYDVAGGSWTSLGGESAPGAAAALLADGRVLVTGGDANPILPPTRVLDPATGAFSPVANDPIARASSIAIRLPDGKVLVAGGVTATLGSLSTVEIYDPVANSWSAAPSLSYARANGWVVPLTTGKSLLLGGFGGVGPLGASDVLDPATRTWTGVAAGPALYGQPAIGPLAGDRALVASADGFSGVFDLGALAYTSFVAAPIEGDPASAPLGGGRVLVAGGTSGSAASASARIFALLSNGEACAADVPCSAGHCVDGVCCASACTGPCVSCSTGTCAPITGAPPGTRGGCGGYLCAAGACATSCASTSACVASSYCAANVCAPRKAKGVACGSAGECASGLSCVDGVCCDSACGGACEACDVAGSLGTCTAVAGAPHGARPACTGAGVGTDCGPRCDGVARTACGYPGSSDPCGAYRCAAGVETHVSTCDGAGACKDVARSCVAYGCDANACKSICASAADCAPGYRCAAGACVPREGLGKPCTDDATCATGSTAGCVDGVCCGVAVCPPGLGCAAPGHEGTCTKNVGTSCANDAECGTGRCVDGVCCDRACAGQCEACDVPGHFGSCFPVKGKPHGGRARCKVDASSPCADESCDGAVVDRCAGLAGPEIACRAASCSGSSATAAATCDGKGACPAPVVGSCGGFTCDGDACRTACADAKDCVDGYECREAGCAPKGPVCSKDLLSSIAPDGTATSCAPFVCKGGACPGQCATSNDCIAGRLCDAASKACVEAAPAAGGTSGGCSVMRDGASRAPGAWSLVLGGALALAARRRRRRSARDIALGASAACAALAIAACSPRAVETERSALAIARDAGLAPKVPGAGRLRGAMRVTLPERAHDATLLEDGDASLAIEPLGLGAGSPRHEGVLRVFAAAARDLDVVHFVDADGTRAEELRVLRSASAPTVARYRLRTTLSLRVRDGLVEAVDARGVVRFVADRPFAVDADGVRRALEVRLDDDVLVVSLDARGLAYPIAVDPGWTTAAPMPIARYGHLALATSDGRVALVGGQASDGSYVGQIDFYDPLTNVWKSGKSSSTLLVTPSAAALTGGKILEIATLQLYDPAADAWSAAAPFPGFGTRAGCSVLALSDGRALLYAGYASGAPPTSTWVYAPAGNAWVSAGAHAPRVSGAYVALTDGSALAVGGYDAATAAPKTDAERWDPTTASWSSLAGPGPTGYTVAALRKDGKLVAFVETGVAQPFLFDPATKAWSALPALPGTTPHVSAAFGLADGSLAAIAAGPGARAVVLDKGAWLDAGPMPTPAYGGVVYQQAGTRVVGTGGNDTIRAYATTFVLLRQPDGGTCGSPGECASGHCVDGVCCDAACTESCKACNLASKIGTCSAVTGAPVGARSGCAPYLVCSAGACVSSCGVDADCVSSHWCTGGVCAPKAANGGACSGARGCTSGFCVDGVCCDTACKSQCAACDAPGKVGTCAPIPGTPHGTRAACAGFGAGTTCGIACDGADVATCHYPGVLVACSASACGAAVETHASTCNGLGKCSDVPKSCGAFACGATSCRTSCSKSADCAPGFFCDGATCAPTHGLGQACTDASTCATGSCVDGVCCGSASCPSGSSCANAGRRGSCSKSDGTGCGVDAECGSGACVDGLCCESRCEGQCQACDVKGQEGRCAPVTGAPRGGRVRCPADADPCKGTSCDGQETARCAALAGPETSCRAASCAAGSATRGAACNGTGVCPAPVTASCDGYACDSTTSGCRTSCATPGDCASGWTCRASRCVPAAAACSDDLASVIAVDGTASACAPYVCRDGTCLGECVSSADCAAGTICDPSTKGCVVPASAGGEASGGCVFTNGAPNATGASDAALLGAVVALLLWRARRRASGRRVRERS